MLAHRNPMGNLEFCKYKLLLYGKVCFGVFQPTKTTYEPVCFWYASTFPWKNNWFSSVFKLKFCLLAWPNLWSQTRRNWETDPTFCVWKILHGWELRRGSYRFEALRQHDGPFLCWHTATLWATYSFATTICSYMLKLGGVSFKRLKRHINRQEIKGLIFKCRKKLFFFHLCFFWWGVGFFWCLC